MDRTSLYMVVSKASGRKMGRRRSNAYMMYVRPTQDMPWHLMGVLPGSTVAPTIGLLLHYE